MNPAPSVIFFSVLSGLGFGLLAYLGFGFPVLSGGMVAFTFFLIGYALAVGGLLCASLHLANPKNAIKSFSQWRTSWLSREAWAAVVSLCVMGIYAALILFYDTRIPALGWVAGALCLFTVFTTSMIYTQIKAVPRWNHISTPVMFMAYAVSGGALLSGNVEIAGILLLLAGLAQLWNWIAGDKRFAEAGSTINTATGLKGDMRQFEPPHTGDSYLLREMVYQVGRKHRLKLRLIALLGAAIIPSTLMLMPVTHWVAILAVVLHLVGVFAARWLFFAEAEHVVGLYYDAR
jgi:DMSO reductase anchor subunit